MSDSMKGPGFVIVNGWAPAFRTARAGELTVHPFSQYTNEIPLRDDGDFAKEILYHRLSVSLTAGGPPNCTYLDGSGIVQYAEDPTLTQSDMDDFMEELQYGPPVMTRGLYNMSSAAPDIVVKRPCFVVIELHVTAGLKFVRNDAAIETEKDFSVSKKYCNLIHYDAEWLSSTTKSSATEDTFLVQFGVHDVSPTTSNTNDNFNLRMQMGDDQHPTFIFIDPALKNRGPR